MKRLSLVLVALALLLAACSSGPVRDAYTASGDATTPDDLSKTRTFRADDDLNIVVQLNVHTRTLPVYAVFTAPNGSIYGTDLLEADQSVGEILLGLDWELSGGLSWPTGEWTVDVVIDETVEETLTFTVNPIEAPAQ